MRQSVRHPAFFVLYSALFGTLLGTTMRAEVRQSLVLTPGAAAESRPIPNTAPYKAMKDLRVEFRLHDYSPAADWNSWVVRLPDFAIRFAPPSSVILYVSDLVDEPGSKIAALELKGRKTDILARFQRNFASKTITLEVWDIDGTNYAVSVTPLTGMPVTDWAGKSIALGGGTMRTQMAYLRLYSNVVPLKSPPPAHADADLGDWEFDGSLSDKSVRGLDMKVAGGQAGFHATPSYPAKA